MNTEEIIERLEKLEEENQEIKEKNKQIERENQRLREIIEEKTGTKNSVDNSDENFSRRDFLKKLGAGAAGLGAISLTPVASNLKITTNGIIGTNTNNQKIQDIEQLNTQTINTKSIRTDFGGSGYSWQDLTSSRSFGVWEQAPADRDIWFTASVWADSDGTDAQLNLHINTEELNNEIYTTRQTIDNNSRVWLPTFRVPAGQYYKVVNQRDTGSQGMDHWIELR